MTSKPLQPLSGTTEAPCPHFTTPEKPPETQAPLQARESRAHTQEPRAEQPAPDLFHPVISTASSESSAEHTACPKNPSQSRDSCQATAGTFRDELQRAAEYSEAGLAPLGAIVEELVAQPVATFPTRHLEKAKGGVGSNLAFKGPRKTSPGVVFWLNPKGSGV